MSIDMKYQKTENMPKRDEKSLQAKLREMNLDDRLEFIEMSYRIQADNGDSSKKKTKSKSMSIDD